MQSMMSIEERAHIKTLMLERTGELFRCILMPSVSHRHNSAVFFGINGDTISNTDSTIGLANQPFVISQQYKDQPLRLEVLVPRVTYDNEIRLDKFR